MTELIKENVCIYCKIVTNNFAKNEFRDNFLIGVMNISKKEDESFEFNFSDRDNYLSKMIINICIISKCQN